MRPSCRISIQERNCYCNGPGEWNKNMLQCGKCRRWYHDNCVQCLENPMLCGDKFFVFICSICNSNFEFLARLELKWVDIAHLVLYNLALSQKKRYFDFNSTVMPYLSDYWSKMNLLGGALGSSIDERKQKLLQALQENGKRFKSGKEVKRKRTLWCLRELAPPVAPHIVPVPSYTEQEVTIWEFKVHGRKSKVLFTGKKQCQEMRKGNTASKNSASALSENKKCSSKTADTSKNANSAPQNGNKKSSVCKTKKPRSLVNVECAATFGLLDTLIPILPNYKGRNNPFRTLNSDFKGKGQYSSVPSKRRKLDNVTENVSELPRQCISNGQAVVPHCNGMVPNFVGQQNSVNNPLPFDSSKFFKTKLLTMNNGDISSRLKNTDTSDFQIVGRRTGTDGKVQFLFEWKT